MKRSSREKQKDKIVRLFNEGKAFLEEFQRKINYAERQLNTKLTPSWEVLFIVALSQIPKALVRDIAISPTVKDAMRYIRQRKRLWDFAKSIDLSKLLREGRQQSQAMQSIFFIGCLTITREHRVVDLGMQIPLKLFLQPYLFQPAINKRIYCFSIA